MQCQRPQGTFRHPQRGPEIVHFGTPNCTRGGPEMVHAAARNVHAAALKLYTFRGAHSVARAPPNRRRSAQFHLGTTRRNFGATGTHLGAQRAQEAEII